MMAAIFFAVAFGASVVGAICGIGGGIVIKPVLDALDIGSPATINFLSGCTVLSMSLYSVGRSLRSGGAIDTSRGTPLAIGAAFGGVVGKELFSAVKDLSGSAAVGAAQASTLLVITIGTLVYTISKDKIKTHDLSSRASSFLIGSLLGVMSSFLGIGGGPINLVVLAYLFSMTTKTAAANSLYIILFSQATSIISTIATLTVPPFDAGALLLMIAGGVGGGIVGRRINRSIDDRAVNKLFIALMIAIIGICAYNITRLA